jgi:hypothetical protein
MEVCLTGTRDLRKSEQRYLCEFNVEFETVAAGFSVTVEAVIERLVALRAIPSVSVLAHVDKKSLRLRPDSAKGKQLSIEVIPPGKFATS